VVLLRSWAVILSYRNCESVILDIFCNTNKGIMCDEQVLSVQNSPMSMAAKVPRIVLQRAEEVFPICKELLVSVFLLLCVENNLITLTCYSQCKHRRHVFPHWKAGPYFNLVLWLMPIRKGARIVQADSGSDSDSESRNKNEEIIPVNRLTPTVCTNPPEPATTIRTCTVKQRTFFVPTDADSRNRNLNLPAPGANLGAGRLGSCLGR